MVTGYFQDLGSPLDDVDLAIREGVDQKPGQRGAAHAQDQRATRLSAEQEPGQHVPGVGKDQAVGGVARHRRLAGVRAEVQGSDFTLVDHLDEAFLIEAGMDEPILLLGRPRVDGHEP